MNKFTKKELAAMEKMARKEGGLPDLDSFGSKPNYADED